MSSWYSNIFPLLNSSNKFKRVKFLAFKKSSNILSMVMKYSKYPAGYHLQWNFLHQHLASCFEIFSIPFEWNEIPMSVQKFDFYAIVKKFNNQKSIFAFFLKTFLNLWHFHAEHDFFFNDLFLSDNIDFILSAINEKKKIELLLLSAHHFELVLDEKKNWDVTIEAEVHATNNTNHSQSRAVKNCKWQNNNFKWKCF